MALDAQKRDLLTLGDGKESPRWRLRCGRKMRWWHAAGLPEPPGSHGRRYPGIHRGVSLDRPAAIADQNARRCSRRPTGGRPGDRRASRRDLTAHRFLVVIATSCIRLLRLPAESAQYGLITYTERLAEAGLEPLVSSVGDSYDNALAETVIGLFTTEVIRRLGAWRSLEAIEFATLALGFLLKAAALPPGLLRCCSQGVNWLNHRRLLQPIGSVPPAEAEATFYNALENKPIAA